MICSFLHSSLTLPTVKEQKIVAQTSQLAFVRKHKADIEKEMGAIASVIQDLPEIKYVIDAMAGSGFSGRVFENSWPGVSLLLNDLSKDCADSLKVNFTNAIVQNVSVEDITPIRRPHLIFIDFNNITLQRLPEWKKAFEWVNKNNPKYFMFTDSASYAFKFNKMYKKDSYYGNLTKVLGKEYDWHINTVCIFGNAAIVLCTREVSPITFKSYQRIPFSISTYKGLFDL